MVGFVFGFILAVLGLTVLLAWSWWRERRGCFDPTHSRTDLIVTTSGMVTIFLGAAVTLTKVVIEMVGWLHK